MAVYETPQLVLVTNEPEHAPSGPLPLARYDAMCRAIVEAHRVDEAKEFRDKAMALAVYARQAQDSEAERRCCEIRLRAERRAGALLREREMAKGGQPFQAIPRGARGVETLAELGISYDQSAQWQKVAAMPAPEFEAAVAAVAMPTIGRSAYGPQPPHAVHRQQRMGDADCTNRSGPHCIWRCHRPRPGEQRRGATAHPSKAVLHAGGRRARP